MATERRILLTWGDALPRPVRPGFSHHPIVDAALPFDASPRRLMKRIVVIHLVVTDAADPDA